VGVVALTAGFAGVLLQPSMALAELCGGASGCADSHIGNIGPGTSDNDSPAPPSS